MVLGPLLMLPIPPQALKGVRIVDLTWLLASAGATTILASLGAEVIRIEWPERLDFTRYSQDPRGIETPVGPGKKDVLWHGKQLRPNPNRGGVFNDRNAGKEGITLNMSRPEGRDLFKRLVAISDVVAEGFTAPTMSKWGLGYEDLRSINPGIIYLQMAGFGNSGPYRNYVSMGPVAQAMSGIGSLNGLPEPHPPTMWNHSYLDTTPPYYGALAIMAAVYYRNRTGKGQYIDQAQYQPGLMLTGTTILDNSSNGRRATRTGNRSQGLPGAPHGIYRCAGVDEWIAIAVVTDEEWRSLCAVMGNPSWSQAPELATMEGRLRLQDDLDRNMEEWTKTQQKYDLMYQLQASRVRAGAVQSPEDKFERDPQLKEQDFFVHLDHSEIGVMPFTRHITAKLSRTPAHPGGPVHRGAPCVGEDNASVYEELLGLSPVEVQSYAEERVI